MPCHAASDRDPRRIAQPAPRVRRRGGVPVLAAGVLLGAVVLALLLPAAPAAAHAELLGSRPDAGATVERAPRRVTLRFSEPIEAQFATVQVFAPGGDRIDRGQPRVDESVIRVPLDDLTDPGTYAVAFRVVSVDGHTVESSFEFTFDPPVPPPDATPTPEAGETGAPSGTVATGAPSAVPSAAASDVAVAPGTQAGVRLQDAGPGSARGLLIARLANHVLFALVVGLLLAAAVLLATPGRLSSTARRCVLAAAGAAGAWAVSGVLLFVFGLSTAAARPLPEALRPELAGRFADTRLGLVIAAQVAVAVAIMAAALLARSTAGARVVLALAALAAVAPAAWGHAATADVAAVAVASDWAHVLAASAWAGGLAVVAVVATRGEVDVAVPAGRFSRIAGWALAVVLLSGVVNALLHVSAVTQLWTTTWGRLVLGKVALFAVIGLVGAVNRRRVVPRLAGAGSRRYARAAFRQFAIVEVAVMLVAFGVATGLAASPPAEAEAAHVPALVTTFAGGQINFSVDPGRVGANTVHLYFLDGSGRPREVTRPTVTLRTAGQPVPVTVYDAGPGHVTALGQPLPRAGHYGVTVTAEVDGREHRATGTIEVR